ncbi:HEAT repeat domain-containing protein [Luteolibacter pohnpeiensis]|uniref:HEAT repeat domain-containing protein n=1 Tax=Luteolibacter pohnpeiensis TaxID=454153 RepID=A0A934S935_9BACT|nr:HEAT repeat domain-containing protein [Luteolibacter pohnpeiensis]MBK1883111.1 HEAT repeat domain-containing protein [Luteolibacter pohnpeiensis]
MKRFSVPLFATLAAAAPLHAETKVFQAFEGDGFGDWKVEGTAFGLAPVVEKSQGMNGEFKGYSGDSLAGSANGGDDVTGALISPEFKIEQTYICFLICGGNHPGETGIELLVDGKPVRSATGINDLQLRPTTWDVTEFKGKTAQIRIFDSAKGNWGMIGVDQILFTDNPKPKFPETTRYGKPLPSPLVATDAVAGATISNKLTMKVAADFKHQQVTSPTAITFDDQGNLYASETFRFRFGVEDDRDNLYWYLDDLASKTTADRRALHEKWKNKVSLKHMTEKSEKILRLVDKDGDGVFETSNVFADGFNDVLDGTGAGVFYYEGTLYFSCIPKLWMLRDSDGDGIAEKRKIIEEGFGVRISLSGHDMNGFTLGPDGRIYGTIGDRGFDLTTKEGVTYHYPDQGALFRFEPDGTGFEIVHTGLRNPKEIAFDEWGDAISVDNNSDQGDAARIVYLVDGGDSGWEMEHQTMHTFHRQIGLAEHPPSRWMNEKMWEMKNDVQPAFMLPPVAYLTSGPSGLTYYPGTGFLKDEQGRFLICDYRGGAANSGVWSFALKQDGAGMKMTDARKFAWGLGATDVEYSWDGKVYISDFVDGWQSHDDGRIVVLDAGENAWHAEGDEDVAKIMREGFTKRSVEDLAHLLKHPDARIRLRAQVELTRHPEALEVFSKAVQSTNVMERLHGIWGLGILARRGAVPVATDDGFSDLPNATLQKQAIARLIPLVKHEDPEVRAQALKVLGDAHLNPAPLGLAKLLKDESPRVQFFAAMAVGKLGDVGNFGSICDFLRRNDNKDPYLRHAGVMALEGLARKSVHIEYLDRDPSPAVRLAAVVALRRMKNPDVWRFVMNSDEKVSDEAIRAVVDLSIDEHRPDVAALLDHLHSRSWTPFMLRRLIHNSFRIGDVENLNRVIQVALDPEVPEPVRKEALRLISIWSEPPPADQLTGHWAPLPKRPVEPIRKALSAALPKLLAQDGFVLTSALNFIDSYKLDVAGLDAATLKSLIENPKLPAGARASALHLYIDGKPDGLAEFLKQLAGDEQDEVALAALKGLAAVDPEQAVAPLKAAVESGKTARSQQAWAILASVPGATAAEYFVQHLQQLAQKNGVSPFAIELMAAAEKRTEPEVATALSDLKKALAENSDPLAKWNPALQGGNAEAGASLFASNPASQCMRCHRAEDGHSAGGEAGPNLAGIANRHDRRYFLESMMMPSAQIAPGFGATLVTFKNGATLGGNLIAETDDYIDLDNAGKAVRIQRSDIESFTAPVSAMPVMAELLSTAEARDIVAWLASLKKGGEAKAATKPEPFDPSTLAPAPKSEPAQEAPKSTPTPDQAAPKPNAETSAIDPAILKSGHGQFMVCAACHGQNGEGTAAAPPLAGSEWVAGPVENLIRIQLRGLQGPIKVKGTEYNMPGGMQPLAYQSDQQIADVLTYIRNSFGNTGSAVTADQVKALRSETGKPQLSAGDLEAVSAPTTSSANATPEESKEIAKRSTKYDHLKPSSGLPLWAVSTLGVLGLVGIIAFLKK